MRIVYQKSHHIFADQTRRYRRRRAERMIYVCMVAVLVFVFIAGMFFGNVLFSNAMEPADHASVKMFHSVQIRCGEDLHTVAEAYYDDLHYTDFDAYLAEICLINHLMDPEEETHAGTYVIVPYYGAPAASGALSPG